jgi:hypothetical protein
MATDYERPADARVPLYNPSSAGYFIGAAVVVAIIGILYVVLN